MKREEVSLLEDKCEVALQSAIKEIDIDVSHHTLHMMAKAAVAVLEAAQEATSENRS